jgi:hypothetical protein
MPGKPHSRTLQAQFASVGPGGFRIVSTDVALATTFVQASSITL